MPVDIRVLEREGQAQATVAQTAWQEVPDRQHQFGRFEVLRAKFMALVFKTQ